MRDTQVAGLQEEISTLSQQLRQSHDSESSLKEEVMKLTAALETCREDHEKV